MSELKRVLRPDGVLLLTTRSPGFPYHPHPVDVWRYTIEDVGRLFCDMIILQLIGDYDASRPGVFLKSSKPRCFSEEDLSGVRVHRI